MPSSFRPDILVSMLCYNYIYKEKRQHDSPNKLYLCENQLHVWLCIAIISLNIELSIRTKTQCSKIAGMKSRLTLKYSCMKLYKYSLYKYPLGDSSPLCSMYTNQE